MKVKGLKSGAHNKSQISNKFQITNHKVLNILVIVIWLLFVI
jgi:hypothetical protein